MSGANPVIRAAVAAVLGNAGSSFFKDAVSQPTGSGLERSQSIDSFEVSKLGYKAQGEASFTGEPGSPDHFWPTGGTPDMEPPHLLHDYTFENIA